MAHKNFPRKVTEAITRLSGEFKEFVYSANEDELRELCFSLYSNSNPLTVAIILQMFGGKFDTDNVDKVLVDYYGKEEK